MKLSKFYHCLALPFYAVAEINSNTALDERSNPTLVIAGLIIDLIPDIINLIQEEDRECAFVGQSRDLIAMNFPDMDVIVYKDLRSNAKGLRELQCYETDLDLAFFREKTYRVCIFRDGRFVLSGDQGYRNWGFKGCHKSRNPPDSPTVDFCSRSSASQTSTGSMSTKVPPTTTHITASQRPSTATVIITSEISDPVTTTRISSVEKPSTSTVFITRETPTPTSLPTATVVVTVDPEESTSTQATGDSSSSTRTSPSRAGALKGTPKPVVAVAVGAMAVYFAVP